MSAIALFLKKQGLNICGSDLVKSKITKMLEKNNIKVYHSHNKKNILGCDLIVYTGAIKPDNEELKFARLNKIKTMERSTFLGKLAKYFKNVIAISGTHGKTTCTALIGYIFILAGLNPTIHLGGSCHQLGGNFYAGSREYFITEACEYRNSFLKLRPSTLLINNVEREHLDFFKSFRNEILSFNKLVDNTKNKCFINFNYSNLFRDNEKIVFFNYINSLNYKNIRYENNKTIFDLYDKKRFLSTIKLNLLGEHNVQNAIAIISLCLSYKIDLNIIKIGLNTFENIERRFEYLGDFNSNKVIHDYAHHPSEIKIVINTCKQVYGKKIVCIFQPHTYSRTKFLMEEFLDCFNDCDDLLIVQTYSARENYIYEGSAELLCKNLKKYTNKFNVNGVYNKKGIIQFLKEVKFRNSILLFLGAGDIELVARKLVE